MAKGKMVQAPAAAPAADGVQKPVVEAAAVEASPLEALQKQILAAASSEDASAAASAVAALVKSKGTADLQAVIATMLEASVSKKAQFAREASVKSVVALAELGRKAESFLAQTLPLVFALHADKVQSVREVAEAAVPVLLALFPADAVAFLLDPIFDSMKGRNADKTKLAATAFLSALLKKAPEQFIAEMPRLIPTSTECMNDMKKEVSEAASTFLTAATSTVGNSDLEPFIPELIAAIKDPTEVPETVHKLAGCVFVQSVNAAALSVVAPILERGFKERAVAVKRQCSVIVENMSKLVDNAVEAMPLMEKLVPALERASDEISDPEARAVAQRAHAQLLKIKKNAEASKAEKLSAEKIAALLVKAGAKESSEVTYVSNLFASLVTANLFDSKTWTELSAGVVDLASAIESVRAECQRLAEIVEVEEDDDDATDLCNIKFTLAYGTKILLHNTMLHLKKGHKYGLLGQNDCGKTTLMRAMAAGQLENFPTHLNSVFVEADIIGELSHLSCLDYVFEDERIQSCGISREQVAAQLDAVGFTAEESTACYNNGVSTLSGGWRMKLALARAMLQKADILLMDEPTNHLDVINVKWVKEYLNSLTETTCVMVSHDSGLLNDVCNNILQIDMLKLNVFKGNLTKFVEQVPEASSYFELKSDKLKFIFPQPSHIEGVKSRGAPLMKMQDVAYTYPVNKETTVRGITIRCSMSSRVACIGRNGAGKSTMIKLLTGEIIPQIGTVWKHNACRVAYVAQHAFHHIEQHMNKTPNEYIQWRYQGGDDKEVIAKQTMVLTEEELAKCNEEIKWIFKDKDGNDKKAQPVKVDRLTGSRRPVKKTMEYEVAWKDMSLDNAVWIELDKLIEMGWGKHCKQVDEKILAREGAYKRPLTRDNVEKHLEACGLDREFGTHYRIQALSGGQKVKVVLAAAMWMQPHIVILDEPTNYLDRESLGALAGAIRDFEGGVVIISHNNQFVSELCPETWLMEDGNLNVKGDAEWMAKAEKEAVKAVQIDEMTDAAGNQLKVKVAKKAMSRNELKKYQKLKAARAARGEEVSEDDE